YKNTDDTFIPVSSFKIPRNNSIGNVNDITLNMSDSVTKTENRTENKIDNTMNSLNLNPNLNLNYSSAGLSIDDNPLNALLNDINFDQVEKNRELREDYSKELNDNYREPVTRQIDYFLKSNKE